MEKERETMGEERSRNLCSNEVAAMTTEQTAASQIENFFNGRSIFLTGATGFLGSVLLETLLRCCPGIEKIYVILREKNGQGVEDRTNSMLRKKVFRNMKSSNPKLLDKIGVMKGDVSDENLGISSEDTKELEEKVSVVFHCAAVISFMKPLRYMLVNNAIGTENVVKFCRRLPNLVALIHTSTAYSNANIKGRIRESIYSLTIPPGEIMEAAKYADDETLEMFCMCAPQWPNNYTFSKAVTEDFLATEVVDLPVAIIRPSIVACCWKGSLPGYVEEGAGITDIGVAIGKGFIRVMYSAENRLDLVPVDVVANTLITASWYMGTGRNVKTPFIVNCTASDVFPVMWEDLVAHLFEFQKLHPLPKMYQSPRLVIRRHWLSFRVSVLTDHYLPAICLDAMLFLMKKKPRLTKMYMFYDKIRGLLRYFLEHEWKFDNGNLKKLRALQNRRDSEVFYMNVEDLRISDLIVNLRTGAEFYEWQNDRRPQEERIILSQKRDALTTFIKWTTILWFFFLGLIIIKGILAFR